MSRLMEIRKERGLTRAALSDLTGIPIRSLEGFEQGRRPIEAASIDTVCILAEVLQVHPADLMDSEDMRRTLTKALERQKEV